MYGSAQETITSFRASSVVEILFVLTFMRTNVFKTCVIVMDCAAS